MAVSFRDPQIRSAAPVLAQSLLAGLAIAGVAFAGSGVVLMQARGLLGATVGLFATLIAALGVGVWVGAPAVQSEVSALRARWMTAGLTVGLAGVVATLHNSFAPYFAAGAGRIVALFVLIAIPSYTLGMVLPALAAWAERTEGDEEAEGWGAFGWVVGGVLTGMVASTLLVGLVLLPAVGPGPTLLGLGAALLVPTLLPEALTEPAETDERVLYDADTPFGSVQVVEVVYPGERQPERRLILNGEEESGELVRSGAPTLAYIAAAERWLVEGTPAGASHLFLGGGAYTLPRRIAERDAKAQISVVELDPEVTRVAYRYFGVRAQHAITTYHGDARAFAERAPAGSFDRIYVDVYTGREALPYSLTTVEAFRALRRLLRPGGWVALNTIGVAAGAEAPRLWSVARTFAEVFPGVGLYTHLGRDFPERQNLLLVGPAQEAAPLAPRAGLFDAWPRADWPDLPQTVVFRDLFAPSAAAEPRDAERSARSAP